MAAGHCAVCDGTQTRVGSSLVGGKTDVGGLGRIDIIYLLTTRKRDETNRNEKIKRKNVKLTAPDQSDSVRRVASSRSYRKTEDIIMTLAVTPRKPCG